MIHNILVFDWEIQSKKRNHTLPVLEIDICIQAHVSCGPVLAQTTKLVGQLLVWDGTGDRERRKKERKKERERGDRGSKIGH